MRFFILILLGAALVAGGCKKKNSAAPVVKKEEPAAPPVDDRNSAPIAGGGAVQNVRQAVKRVDHENDIRNLGVLIFDFELTNGKLPTVSDIKAGMVGGDWASVRKKVDEGVIILTGTTKKDGLWAYEVDADKAGGIVLTGPTPHTRRENAETVKQLLANK